MKEEFRARIFGLKSKIKRPFVRSLSIIALLITVGSGAFMVYYTSYMDKDVYRERQLQMKEVTTQIFNTLDDYVQRGWKSTNIYCNFLLQAEAASIDEMQEHMKLQEGMNEMDEENRHLIAVDETGRCLTKNGFKGTLKEMDFLKGRPQKVSFVSKDVTRDQSCICFLRHLDEPLKLKTADKTCTVNYYGFSCSTDEIHRYYECETYENKHSVYVLNEDGERLFCCGDGEIFGYNAYSALAKMRHVHGESFSKAKQELENEGVTYSNIVSDGTEYFYSLCNIEDCEWISLFIVPSELVAQNVIKLVNAAAKMIFIFAMFLLVLATIIDDFLKKG